MKKLLLGICVLASAQLSIAQDLIHVVKHNAKSHNLNVSTARGIRPVPSVASFWSDDFSNAANWTISNQSGNSDNWVIGTSVPSGSFAIPAITSTSAANGYALFDSDLLCSGDQIADVTTANSINCSSESTVTLSFEQYYRRFDDSTFVFVSVDNVNWTKFPVNEAYANNQSSATNPEVVTVDISSVAANQATVWIRFEFWSPSTYTTGPGGAPGCAYAWMIDDVALNGGTVSGTFDDCANAEDINSAFGGAVGVVNSVGPYDNSTATVGVNDPAIGWECFGEPDGSGSAPELNNNVWFTFTGDGNNYFVESTDCGGTLGANYIDDGDTQFALFTGTSCTGLTPIKCNEDGPSATATLYPAGFSFGTTAGQTYYLMVDGFSFNGAVSSGQFCLAVSRVASVACADPSVTVGSAVANDTTICWGDTLRINVTGAAAPNVGSFYGIGMIISNAPITGSTDPLNDPALIATYGFVDPVPATYTRTLINDGTLIDGTNLPFGVYYWTPVVFGNATPNPNSANPSPVFLSDLILDPACTNTGTSIAVTVYANGDPACNPIGVNEVNATGFGIVKLYPVPAASRLNLDYNSNVKGDVVISVKDQLGRVITSENKAVNNGVNTLSVDLASIASGIYFVTIDNGVESFNARFTKN
ncbi:MAG: T9SS type A sorting domain-containing protein [Bacteroidia bacterium]